MNELTVVLITAFPIALVGWIGHRLGARRLLRFGLPWLSAWAVAALVSWGGLRAGWFYPFGLVTPLGLGWLAAIAGYLVVRGLARRPREEPTFARPSRAQKISGFVLGAAGGLAAASVFWLGMEAAVGTLPGSQARCIEAMPSPDDGAGRWVRSLVRTANRGFVRHLPLIGTASDELEALVVILNTPARDRSRLALDRKWEDLSALPTFRALIEDPDIFDEIDAVGRGNVAALYRLQAHPLVLAFFEETQIQELVAGLRPSVLVREMEAVSVHR